MTDDTVSIVIGGQSYTGWKTLRITRSLEKCPPTFDIQGTDRTTAAGILSVLSPGLPCQVKIGTDLVLTGYVDRYGPRMSAGAHDVRIQGRGKCEDLVDCSITPDIINGMQISTAYLRTLAAAIVSHFGAPTPIQAISLTGNDVPVAANASGALLVFNANLQETPWEILTEVARYAGVLIYEGTDGNLYMANVGTSTMASGFVQGVNIQDADVMFSLDQRYSEYLPVLMSTNVFGQEGIGGVQFPKVFDKGVPRFRPKFVVSSQIQNGQQFAELCAQWEAARRIGRSSALSVICDSWRDSKGTLWDVNAFAPIDIPTLKLANQSPPWVIGQVSFIRDARRGTVAELELMPKEAFLPEPIFLVPYYGYPGGSGAPSAGGGGALPTDTPVNVPLGSPAPGSAAGQVLPGDAPVNFDTGASAQPAAAAVTPPLAGGGAAPVGTFAPRYTQPGTQSDVDAHE